MSKFRFLIVSLALAQAGLAVAQVRDVGLGESFQAQSNARHNSESALYQKGQAAIDGRHWDQAVEAFGEVAEESGSHSDGALYWKAYALNKLGRREEALATIKRLRQTYANSRWLDDAKALEIEVRQASGQKVNPDAEPDEDLKLMALNSLMNSDPERAVPMLEKFLQGNQPLKLKDRALFVLAQSDSPKARQILAQTARTGNPDLQMKAINYLGMMGSKENRKLLSDLYSSSNDVNIRRAILHSFMLSGDKDYLFQAAKTEKNPDLRADAIHQLALTGGQAELWQLYGSETSADIKEKILHSMFLAGNSSKLIELARTEKDGRLRRAAIHSLGLMGGDDTGAALASMYSSETDPSLRGEIINALFLRGDAKALVAMARRENDPKMKKAIVEKLSIMGSKEGTEYLMELLNK